MRTRNAVIMVGSALALLLSQAVFAEEGFFSWLGSFSREKEIAPVTDATYNKECGSCHFPFQPGLLPEASWRKLLDAKALSDHFGDNAELDDQTRQKILDVLVADSADKSYRKRSRKIMKSLGEGDAPLRITEIPYIKAKHSEIPENLVKGNPKVKGLSFCNKCHQKAADGVYDDDTVRIPGKS